MLTNPQISEFPMNSDNISWIVTEFLSEFWCSKVRMVRSLATPEPFNLAAKRIARPSYRRRRSSLWWPSLVEKFDTELFSDCSAKSSNFRRLVLSCINADFCVQILILQRFSRSTRKDSRKLFKTSEIWENLGTKFCRFSKKCCILIL